MDALSDRQQRLRDRMADALRPFGDAAVWSRHSGSDDVVVSGPTFILSIHVDMSRWLGLELEAWLSGDRSTSLHHVIDTDLYPVGQEKYWWFADEIADEIVDLLRSLVSGEIQVGLLRGRPAMVIGRHTVVRRGRFLRTTRALRPQDVTDMADLSPVYQPPDSDSGSARFV